MFHAVLRLFVAPIAPPNAQVLKQRLEETAERETTLSSCAERTVCVCQSLANASDVSLRQKVWHKCKQSHAKMQAVAEEIFQKGVEEWIRTGLVPEAIHEDQLAEIRDRLVQLRQDAAAASALSSQVNRYCISRSSALELV